MPCLRQGLLFGTVCSGLDGLGLPGAPLVSTSPLPAGVLSEDTCYQVLLFMMSGHPNPGPHPRAAGALPPELVPSPGIIFPFGNSITSL